MQTDPKDLLALKKKMEEARDSAAKAEGAFQQTMEVLQKEFGCKTIKEAEAKLAALEAKEQEMQADVDRLMKKFKAKYGDL